MLTGMKVKQDINSRPLAILQSANGRFQSIFGTTFDQISPLCHYCRSWGSETSLPLFISESTYPTLLGAYYLGHIRPLYDDDDDDNE